MRRAISFDKLDRLSGAFAGYPLNDAGVPRARDLLSVPRKLQDNGRFGGE